MYQKTVLDNGLRLLTSTMPQTRSVSISVFVGTGSRYESDEQAGISHFIEHLCFKGTASRPTARDLCSPIEGVGGIFNGGTDKELTVYWSKVARPHFGTALEVLADMMLNSRFDGEDIDKERHVIIEEILMSKDSPAQEVAMLIESLLWPGHPLGRDTAGTRESVTATDRVMMMDWLSSQYQPENMVVAIAGAIENREAVEAVSRLLGGWGQRRGQPRYAPFTGGLAGRVGVETRDTEQVNLCLGLPGLSLTDPMRYALDLLNIILGEGMSSRLFTEVRDRLGLVYSIQSYADHFLDTGALLIAAGTETRNLSTAIKVSLEEVAKIKEPVPEAELTKAKDFYKGRLLLRMEDSRNVAAWVGGQEILTGRVITIDEMTALIDAVTPGQMQDIAGQLFQGDQLCLAVVGPVSREERLEELLKL
ncbi:MAG: insulinase family protein [Chloroflexi bacterium]|nr:insulinase family protein [Chloroflexota bacterium]